MHKSGDTVMSDGWLTAMATKLATVDREQSSLYKISTHLSSFLEFAIYITKTQNRRCSAMT